MDSLYLFNLILRKAREEDLEGIEKIEKSSFPKTSIWKKDLLSKKRSNFPDFFIIAEINKKIVGYIFGTPGEIESIAVAKKWRRKKIGTALLKKLITSFKKRGVKKITLHVRESNLSAISFYLKNNFKIVKKVENYYPGGESALLMETTLS